MDLDLADLFRSHSAKSHLDALKAGDRVLLNGLVARPELNGAKGALLGGFDPETGRAPIRLYAPPEHDGKQLKVKKANAMVAVPLP